MDLRPAVSSTGGTGIRRCRKRRDARLLSVSKPDVETPEAVAEALAQRRLTEWDNMEKALPARVDDLPLPLVAPLTSDDDGYRHY